MRFSRLNRTSISAVLVLVLASLASAPLLARAAAAPSGVSVGAPQTGSVGVARTTSDIMAQEALHAGEAVQADPTWRNEHEFDRRGIMREHPSSPPVASVPS